MSTTEDNGASASPEWLKQFARKFDNKDKYNKLAPQWHVLDEDAWQRCLAKTMIATLEIAQPYDTEIVVAPVIRLWSGMISGNQPSSDEWTAVRKKAGAAKEWLAEEARAKEAEVPSEALEPVEQSDAALAAAKYYAASNAAWAAALAALEEVAEAPALAMECATRALGIASAADRAETVKAQARAWVEARARGEITEKAKDAAERAGLETAALAKVKASAARDKIIDACLSAIEGEIAQVNEKG